MQSTRTIMKEYNILKSADDEVEMLYHGLLSITEPSEFFRARFYPFLPEITEYNLD